MALIARTSVPDEARWRVYNRIATRILPLLLVAYAFASIDRANVAFAKLQMGPALGLSDAMYGFGAGIFFIGYCLFEIPSNMILHRIGARIWLARIMVVWGLLSAATMFVQTPAQFYVIRFLLGVAEAGFYPGALLYMTYWFPSYLRSQTLAVFILGAMMAGIVGSPLSGAIMQFMDGWAGLAGWQWVFVVEGLPAALLGIVFFALLSNKPADARWLGAEEKAMVVEELAAESAAQAAAGMHHRFADAFRNPNIWCVVVANFCNLSTLYGVGFWMPTIIRNATGASLFHTGLIGGALSLIPCVVIYLNGRHSDKTRERRWHAVTGFVISMAGLIVAGSFADTGWLALTGLLIANCGAVIVAGTLFTLPATFVMGAAAAAGFALITTLGNFAGYFSPFLFGVLSDATGSFSAGFFGLCATSAIGAAAVLVTPALRRKAG